MYVGWLVLFFLIDLFVLYLVRYIGGLDYLYKIYYGKWGVFSCWFIVCSLVYWLFEVEVNWFVFLDMFVCFVWSLVYKWFLLGFGFVWCFFLLDVNGFLLLCFWLIYFFNCCWWRCCFKYKLIICLMLYILWLYG